VEGTFTAGKPRWMLSASRANLVSLPTFIPGRETFRRPPNPPPRGLRMAKFFSDHQRDTHSVVVVFDGSKRAANVALPRCCENREESAVYDPGPP
jgi:hypothetical protein